MDPKYLTSILQCMTFGFKVPFLFQKEQVQSPVSNSETSNIKVATPQCYANLSVTVFDLSVYCEGHN